MYCIVCTKRIIEELPLLKIVQISKLSVIRQPRKQAYWKTARNSGIPGVKYSHRSNRYIRFNISFSETKKDTIEWHTDGHPLFIGTAHYKGRYL